MFKVVLLVNAIFQLLETRHVARIKRPQRGLYDMQTIADGSYTRSHSVSVYRIPSRLTVTTLIAHQCRSGRIRAGGSRRSSIHQE